MSEKHHNDLGVERDEGTCGAMKEKDQDLEEAHGQGAYVHYSHYVLAAYEKNLIKTV